MTYILTPNRLNCCAFVFVKLRSRMAPFDFCSMRCWTTLRPAAWLGFGAQPRGGKVDASRRGSAVKRERPGVMAGRIRALAIESGVSSGPWSHYVLAA